MKNRSLAIAFALVLLGTSGSAFGAETEQPKQSFVKKVAKKVKEAINSPKFLIPAAVVGIGVLAVAGWYYVSKSSLSTWSERIVFTKAEYTEHLKMIKKNRLIYRGSEAGDKVRADACYELAGNELYWIEPISDGNFRKRHDNLIGLKGRRTTYQEYLQEAADLGHVKAQEKLNGPLPDVFNVSF